MYILIGNKQTFSITKFLTKYNCHHCHYKNEILLRKCYSSNVLPSEKLGQTTLFSRRALNNPEYALTPNVNDRFRYLHTSTSFYYADTSKHSSKVEETVQALKEKAEQEKVTESSNTEIKVVTPKKSIKQKIVDEIVHYYHGFRLLFIDIKISTKLGWRVLNGNQLTRREHNLLVRTVSDMFRLVPFSVFIIVPFMEFLLPVFIKLFPGMLPTTFQTDSDKEKKFKQSLKVKIEMAKFLQETLDNMSVKAHGHYSKDAKEFIEFFEKVRSEGGGICTSEEIMKFSKLFEDEITLDSLPRPQLVALCRVLEIQPIGTSNFLRFQLRMKIRSLVADDLMIQKEGINSLSPPELQQACRSRGMRAYGLSEERLKFQLSQWLDLSLNKKVPQSLLLLSRAFMLPETIPTTDKLKATISALPETVGVSTKAVIGEREGKVDNKTKIEIIKEEERRIQEERLESAEEQKKLKEMEDKERLRQEAELLVDKASQLVDTAIDLEPNILKDSANKTQKTIETVKKKLEEEEVSIDDIKMLENALNILADQKNSLHMEKEELEDLKEELADYKEDVEDLQEVLKTADGKQRLKETRAAKGLFKQVNNMIKNMDELLVKLENKEKVLKETIGGNQEISVELKSESDELLRIDELMDAIRKLQKVSDDSKLNTIEEVLSKIDEDHDGSVRIDTVAKVLELIGTDSVKLSTKQIDEIIDLLEKEQALVSDDPNNGKAANVGDKNGRNKTNGINGKESEGKIAQEKVKMATESIIDSASKSISSADVSDTSKGSVTKTKTL